MTKPKKSIEVRTAILCDDVRREWNGKDILIGVYGSGLKVEAIPTFLVVSAWLECYMFEAGEQDLWVQVIGPNGEVVFRPPAAMKASGPGAGFGHFPIPGIALQISSTGPYKLQISLDANEWETVRTVNVEVGAIDRPKI